MALVPAGAHYNAPADKGTRFASLFTKVSGDAQPPLWSQSSIGQMGNAQRMLFVWHDVLDDYAVEQFACALL